MSEQPTVIPAPPGAPQQYTPAPQQYTLAPQQYAPAPQQYAPAPEPYAISPTHAPLGTAQPPATGSVPKHRRGRWLWWTAGSLVGASLAGLCVYLAIVAHQWSDRVDDLTAVSQDLGIQVSEQTAARKEAKAKAATLQSQLDTATARITDLANEEANATDHELVWISLVDSLIECSDERQYLIEALKDRNSYYPGKSKAQVENEITEYCDSLTNDYATFKTEIGK